MELLLVVLLEFCLFFVAISMIQFVVLSGFVFACVFHVATRMSSTGTPSGIQCNTGNSSTPDPKGTISTYIVGF